MYLLHFKSKALQKSELLDVLQSFSLIKYVKTVLFVSFLMVCTQQLSPTDQQLVTKFTKYCAGPYETCT